MSDIKRKTIFIVEDDSMLAFLTSRQLEKAGYRAIIASTGEEAIDTVNSRKEHIDLILMDIDLGKGIDGTQAAKEILKENDIPVVFHSSHLEPELVSRTESITSYGYIVKSGTPTVLYTSIKMAFNLFAAKQARQKSENALRAAERFSQSLLENMEAGVVACNSEGELVLFNHVAREWHGLDPAAIPQDEWAKYYDLYQEDGITLMDINTVPLSRAYRGELVRNVCMVIAAKGKPKRYVSVNATPVRDNNGRINGAVTAMHDITWLKNSENKLKESEQIYRAIGETINYGVWVCEPDGRNIYASESFLKLVGLTQKECSDFGWGEVLHPEDAQRTIDAWKECVRTCGKWNVEHRFKGVDGKWHNILARGVPVRDEKGQIKCWAGINLDIDELKQAQAELSKKNELLSGIMDNSPSLIYILDLNGRFIACNKHFEEVLNKTRDEIIGKKREDLLPKEIALQHEANDLHVISTNKPSFFEEINIEPDGTHYYLTTKFPLINKKNEIYGIAGVSTEITERKIDEKKIRMLLKEKESLLRADHRLAAIINSAEDAIISKTMEGMITSWNKGAEKIYGYSKEEVIGKSILILYPENKCEELNEILSKIKNGEAIEHYESVRVTKDRREIYVSLTASPIRNDERHIIGASIISHDITERKKIQKELKKYQDHLEELVNERTAELKNEMLQRIKTEEELADSEKLFTTQFNLANIGLAITSLNKTWLKVNNYLCRMLGYTEEELRKITWIEITHPDDVESDLKLFNRILSSETASYEVDKRFVRKDGITIYTHLTIGCVYNKERKIQYFIVSIEDLSNREKDEQERLDLERQLLQSQKLEAIGEIAGGIAHDLNNILSTIGGFAELVLSDYEEDNEGKKYIQHIYDLSRNGIDIVRHNLDFLKQKDTSFEAIEVESVINQALLLLKSPLKRKAKVSVSVIPKHKPFITGDSSQILQVFLNLFANACDAIEDKYGVLEIIIDEVLFGKDDITIKELKAGRYVQVIVKDNGKGITPEAKEKVFDAFFTTKGEKGTGLGLSIVKRIMRAHSGAVTVDSNLGEGTAFTLYFPVDGPLVH